MSTALHSNNGSMSSSTAVNPTPLTTEESNSIHRHNEERNGPPPLKFHWHPKNPILYILFLIVCNVVLPVILYYVLEAHTSLSKHATVGISSAALGLSSCFDAPFRLWKLVKKRELYGPLLDGSDFDTKEAKSHGKWFHLDFFMWYYQWAMFWWALPLIAPIWRGYQFFIMAFPVLTLAFASGLALSLYPWKSPVRISSDPKGTRIKPLVFTIVEDVVAVDFCHGKEWRRSMHERWHSSPIFRNLMYRQTIYWTLAACVEFGIGAAITWTTPYDFAFGAVLGFFFVWAGIAGLISYFIVKFDLKREKIWWQQRVHTEEKM